MTYHALLEYVRRGKDCGASDAEITDRLLKAGWYRVDIQDALSLYRKLAEPLDARTCDHEPPPKPRMVERIVPHSYDPQLVAIAAITFAVAFIVYLVLTR
jgi:hypothetical protein